MWVTSPAAVAVLGGALATACGPGSSFTCEQDGDCGAGTCVSSYCAFPDDTCPSGLRYGEHSGALSGECTPPEQDATTGGVPTSTGSVGSAATTADASSGGPATTATTDPTTGGPQTGPVEFVDDELIGEFDQGVFTDIEYTNGRLRLADGARSGSFVSRVFDASAPVQWEVLSWRPDAPYAKPLPDDGAAETEYVDAIDMVDNILLMHFDEPGTLGPRTVIADHSGRGNDGTIASAGPASSAVGGLFGNAIDDNPDAYISIPPGGDDFDFGVADFTWAIWFRFDHDCSTNNVFVGVDDVVGGGDNEAHLWMGCTISDWEECPGTVSAPRPAGVLRSEQSNLTEGVFFCGPDPVGDGAWHHMALVKQGHDPTMVALYVDGENVATVNGSFVASLDLDAQEGDFALGGFSGGTFPSQGEFDDAAIWTRALTDAEVRGLYRRGALKVTVEVRVCGEPDCADEPAFGGGPGLQPGVGFTDPADSLAPGGDVAIDGLVIRRYAQYRLNFATEAATGASPAIGEVALRGVYAN